MSVVAAGATLARAATFWAGRSPRLGWEPEAAARARYTGNCFRELDGFLRLLLDARATVPTPRQRNTANKLAATIRAEPYPSDVTAADCARLRAIGRSAACLFHLGGEVRRPDAVDGSAMTAGWPDRDGGALRRYRLGELLRPDADDVADVCGFFLRIGEAFRT